MGQGKPSHKVVNPPCAASPPQLDDVITFGFPLQDFSKPSPLLGQHIQRPAHSCAFKTAQRFRPCLLYARGVQSQSVHIHRIVHLRAGTARIAGRRRVLRFAAVLNAEPGGRGGCSWFRWRSQGTLVPARKGETRRASDHLFRPVPA